MRIGILFLVSLSALFTSFSHANTCPIGKRYDRVEFPLGTPIVYSVCIDGCRGEQKFNDLDTWTCTENLGKCVALYTLTGQSCSGQDDTDGSCDPTGNNCTTEPDTGNPDPDPEPEPTDPNPDSAILQRWNKPDFYRCYGGDTGTIGCTGLQGAFAQLDKVIDNKLTYQKTNIEFSVNKAKTQVIDKVLDTRSDLADIKGGVNSVLDEVSLTHNDVKKTLDNTEDIKEQLNSVKNFGSDIEGLHSHLEQVNNQVYSNVNPILLEVMKIDPLYNTINDSVNSLTSMHSYETWDIKRKIDELKNSLDGNNSGVADAVISVGTKIDGLGENLKGLGDELGGLSDKLGGEGLSKGEHGSLINFGETPLYKESEVEKLTQEVADLKEQYTEKVNDFKKLFSLNLDSLSNGEYREHFLDFEFANGAKLRAGSSVFPALIDNSGLIAAVILFVAVIAGLRVVMGAKD